MIPKASSPPFLLKRIISFIPLSNTNIAANAGRNKVITIPILIVDLMLT